MSAPAVAQPGFCDCRWAIPAQGPYNIVRSLSIDDLHYELHQKQCDLQIRTHEQARSLGFPVNSSVYGIPVKMGDFTFSDGERDSWKRLNCSAHDERLDRSQRAAFESFTASPEILNTYLKCTMTCAPGVHVIGWATDDCTISFRFNYVDPSDDPVAAKVRTPVPDVTGGTCKYLPELDSKIAAGGRIYTCHRSGRSAVTLRINTDKGPAEDTVAPLPDLRPKPQPPVLGEVWTNKDSAGNDLAHECRFDHGAAIQGKGLAKKIVFEEDCRLPPDTRVAGAVTYGCESCCGGCAHSYHTTKNTPSNYDPDYTLLPDGAGIHWRRKIDGSPVIIRHIIPYERKVTRCVANCDFEQRQAEYEASKPEGCPRRDPDNASPQAVEKLDGRGGYVAYFGQHMPPLIAMATGAALILAAAVGWRFRTRR